MTASGRAALKLPELSERRAQESSECAGAAEEMPIRRFSSELCWLLSLLTSGTMTKGTPSASSSLSVGTLPPIMRMRTVGALTPPLAKVLARAPRAQAPSSESIGVKAALLHARDERGDLVIFGALLVGRLALREVVPWAGRDFSIARDQISRVSACSGAKIDSATAWLGRMFDAFSPTAAAAMRGC